VIIFNSENDMDIIKYTQEEFEKSDEFLICEEIYLDKYFLEYEYSLDDLGDLLFYIYRLDNIIIGFGSIQIGFLNIIDTNFIDEFKYSDRHIELVNHIIDDNKIDDIYIHLSYRDDYEFYLKMGFKLFKDYGQFFPIGLDRMRYSIKQSCCQRESNSIETIENNSGLSGTLGVTRKFFRCGVCGKNLIG
jgi:hypothetical protein